LQGYCDFITDDMVFSGIALAGGGARARGGNCGAFSAGLMAISVKMSPRTAETPEKEQAELEKMRAKCYEFRDWFIAEYSGISCLDALHKLFGGNFDQSKESDRKRLAEIQKAVGFNCEALTAKVAVKLAEMLELQ
jgi:hypothetical protein